MILAALAFWLVVARLYGAQVGLEYLTGYVIERALSVDNIVLFVVIFNYFAVPAAYQRRVLYWGVLGGLVMRGAFILAGASLVAAFHWALYAFGAFLVWSGLHLLWSQETAPAPERNPVVRLAVRLFPVTPKFHGPRFFVRLQGGWHATPLKVDTWRGRRMPRRSRETRRRSEPWRSSVSLATNGASPCAQTLWAG